MRNFPFVNMCRIDVPGGPEKTFPTLRSYFQEVFLGMKVIFCRCIEQYPIYSMCDEFHPYRSISFHVIRSNRHGYKNYFFASLFIGTRERKDLQQPEPQRSDCALTAQHCSLLCPVISCLMWLGCPLATFSVELLQDSWTSLKSTSTSVRCNSFRIMCS